MNSRSTLGLIRKLLVQWGATVYVGLVSFVVSAFIARTTGPSTFGEYSVALAAGAILGVFIDGGMRSLLMREHARCSLHLKHLSVSLLWIARKHALSFAFLASILAYALLSERLAISFATIACILGVTLIQFITAIFRGEGKLLEDAGWQIGQRTLSAICIVSFILIGFDSAWHILAVWAGASICSFLIFTYGMYVKPFFKYQSLIYRTALPLLWIELATAIYFRSDMIMLKLMGVTDDNIGQYAAAYRLVEAVMLLTNPVAILFFRHIRKSHDNFNIIARDIIRAALLGVIIGVLFMLIIYQISEFLVFMTYGSTYLGASTVLAVLSMVLVFVIPNAILTQAALALELDRSYAWAATASAIGNITLNYFFIGQYGLIAAVWSTIASEIILMLVLFCVLKNKLKERGLYINSCLNS